MPNLPKLLVLALLLGVSLPLAAQTPADQTPVSSSGSVPTPIPAAPYDPHTAISTAFQHLDDAERDVRRFTYLLDIAMADVGRSGRTRDLTSLRYEATYINGLLYMHLIEQNGFPLTGSALKDEQKRYDKALAKRKALNQDKRADSDDYSIVKPDFQPQDVLSPAYTLSVFAAGLLKGEPAHVIDAKPTIGAKRKSHCPWHIRFWISDKSGNLRRYTADTSGDTSPECVNEVSDTQFIEVDGIPKISVQAALFNMPDERGMFYASKSRATYSNYRRFGASVTFKTGDVIPPDDAAPSPPPPGPAQKP